MNKRLARSNKSGAGSVATKDHRQRGAISNVADRLDPLRVSAAGLSQERDEIGLA
jgi:hypothetical protein